jgi:hypothetical protein
MASEVPVSDFDPGEAPESATMSLGEMLDDLDDCGILSDWELNFVDDMLRRREFNPDLWEVRLSEKQTACLRSMWEKRCA